MSGALSTAETLANTVLTVAASAPAVVAANSGLLGSVAPYVSKAENVITTATGYIAELESILSNPEVQDVGTMIEKILGLTAAATTKAAVAAA